MAWLRWIDWASSASAMIMLDGVLWLAPPTVQALTLQFAVMWLVCIGGAGSEAAWAGRRFDAWAIFWASLGPFVAMWGVQWSLFDLGRRGEGGRERRGGGVERPDGTGQTPPDFVIIIISVLFATYMTFPAAHFYRLWSDAAEQTRRAS